MKKLLLSLVFVGFYFLSTAQCLSTTLYPSTTYNPTNLWGTINSCNFAGDYALVSVVAGNIYQFSTLSANGSNVAYDSELTLTNTSNTVLAYNDDYSVAISQSQITWTATFTGTVRIHLAEWPCFSNLTCSTIRVRMISNAAQPANNACANATVLTPSANCNLTNGTTLGATEDAILDPSCDPGTINDVWYTFNSGAYTSLNLTVNLVSAEWIGVEFYTACGTLASGISLNGTLGSCDFNTSAPNPTVISGLTTNTVYRFRLFTNIDFDYPGTFTACLTTPPPPTVTVNSQSVCAGQSVTLTATPSAAGGTYLWSNGATTQSITVTPNATTSYSVTYTNNGTGSGSGTVTVNPLPTINGGQDQTVCQGANVTLSATGGTSYAWNNGVSNGVAFVPNTTTTYTVTGTDANGCTNTDQVLVTVNPNPSVTAPANQSLCAGASTTPVTFTGTAGATYTWVNTNTGIGLGATGTGNISAFIASNASSNPITSTVTVTPVLAGCSGTPQTFTYTVNPIPSVTNPGNQTACAGNNTAAINFTGTAGATYNWTNSNPNIGLGASGTGSIAPFVGVAGNATISVTPTLNNCSGAAINFTITINPTPTITGNTVICPSTTSQLTGSGAPAANNAWSSNNNGVATISNTGLVTAVSFGTATITYTNTNGCTATTTVNVSNPTTPTFNPIAAVCSGAAITLPATSTNNIQGTWSPAVNNTQTTTYTFTPSAGQCATNTTLTVNVNPLPTINAGQDQTVCQGANVTLSATGGSTYSWNNGVSNGVAFVANATTTYTVTGTNANGCSNTDQVVVNVNANPTLTGNTVLCPSTTSQLTANANPNVNSPWVSSNAAVATVSNAGLVTAVGFGTATITFTNNNGCTGTTTINVTNPVAPTFNPIAPVCSGSNITLPGTSTNNVQGTWSPAVNNTQTTTYTFTPSVGQCATTAQVTVTVNPTPSITGGNTLCVGSSLQLTGSGAPAANSPWVSGTPATGSVSNTGLFTAIAPGSSTVTYTNTSGCSANVSITAQGPVNGATQQVTACLSYVWHGQTYTQSGTYSDTLQTVAGCDSIVGLNLTISNSITGPTTQQNSCGPYTWNGQTYTQSGTYTYQTTTQNGCDSSATLVLTINQAPSNVQVTLTQGTFTVTGQNANNYAWMDCATNTLIPGQNNATFTPAVSGSYAAIISNACGADTSTCEPIEVQGLVEPKESQLTILPNPTNGEFQVVCMNDVIESVMVYNMWGELLNQVVVQASSATLDIKEYASGCYLVKTLTSQGISTTRIIKN